MRHTRVPYGTVRIWVTENRASFRLFDRAYEKVHIGVCQDAKTPQTVTNSKRPTNLRASVGLRNLLNIMKEIGSKWDLTEALLVHISGLLQGKRVEF